MEEWDVLSNIAPSVSPVECPPLADDAPAAELLQAKGLEKYAEKIAEVSDALTVGDLKMMDAAMVEEVIKAADIKLITAKKFRLAIAELRGEPARPGTPMALSPAAATQQPPPPTAMAGSTDEAAASAAAAASEPAVEEGRPQECVVVCVDRSGSMGAPFLENTINVVKGESKQPVLQRSRMEAVKAMFYAFRDRVECLDEVGFQLGLVQFDDKVKELLALTPKLDLFEQVLDNMEKGGQTAIYDAISVAARMLQKHFGEDSQTDLRILVLTDGQNNTGQPPEAALQAVNDIGAVVDAIIVGDRPDSNLRKIVTATEGECWQINDLGEGFELLEAESAVSVRARRGGADRPQFKRREAVEFSSLAMKTMTKGSAVQRAPILADGLAQKKVVDVVAATKTAEAAASRGSGGGPVVRRLLKELKDIEVGGGSAAPGVHIFPSEDDLSFWRALLEGPEGTPFAGGVFLLNITFPHDYPFKPPKIKFETPIYHCNINDSGGVCIDILKDNWSPALSACKALISIRNLMTDPNTDDALRHWIAELTVAYRNSNGADTRYYEKARELTQQHASRTVEEWKQTWGCS